MKLSMKLRAGDKIKSNRKRKVKDNLPQYRKTGTKVLKHYSIIKSYLCKLSWWDLISIAKPTILELLVCFVDLSLLLT